VQLIASGRDSDVFEYDDGLVLRRYRDGRPAEREAATIRALGELGYPVPAVHRSSGPDIVMERVTGPTLAEAVQTGAVTLDSAARSLARLHNDLHALPWPGASAGESLLHLDFHPLNVIAGESGPVVIDWSNAELGPAGLDVAMTALILAQVAVTPGMLPDDPELEEMMRAGAGGFIRVFVEACVAPYLDHLPAAQRLRALDPNLSARELALLGEAAAFAARP
jgi:aminoglycoside phosphotransferase (APT) family kinase protein